MEVVEIKNNGTVAFGDLNETIDLIKRSSNRGFGTTGHLLQRRFHDGNYVLSVLNDNGAGTDIALVIHHENVDPTAVMKKLETIEGYDTWESKRPGDLIFRKVNQKSDLIFPSDWFSTERLDEHGLFSDMKDGEDDLQMWPCQPWLDKPSAEQAQRQWSHWQMAMSEQLYKTHEKDGTEVAEARASKEHQLFYFVTDLPWSKANTSIDLKLSLGESNAYKIEVNCKPLGFAVNPVDILGEGHKCGVLIQDTKGHYFALVMQNAVQDKPFWAAGQKTNIVVPIEDFLYENEYRCFDKSGTREENEFYGGDGSTAFDFSRLPENIFTKILLQLTWREQLLCRRVSRRWVTASNSVLAINTKVIDCDSPRFQSMEQSDLGRLLSIVADGLESLNLPLNLDLVSSVTSFRWLKEIDLGYHLVQYDQFFQLLDKCPKLKTLRASVPAKPSNSAYVPKAYDVEQLHLYSLVRVTDPYLMAIADYFPNLSRLCIPRYKDFEGCLTDSCLSAFVERYGSKMHRLEISGVIPAPSPRFGAFTGIAACSGLTHLSLAVTCFVSDLFMTALSTGCGALETLDLEYATEVTNNGLSALAALPNLKRLNVGGIEDISGGIIAIAMAGCLEQLLAMRSGLSANCVKACVRHCPRLRLVDMCMSDASLTVDDAEEIANLYGRFGQTPRLTLRSYNDIWRNERVAEIQIAIKEGNLHHRGRLVIDFRSPPSAFMEDGYDIDENTLDYEDEADEMSDFSGGIPDEYGHGFGYDYGFDFDDGSYDEVDDMEDDGEDLYLPEFP